MCADKAATRWGDVVPLAKPYITPEDHAAVRSVLESGQLVQGPTVARFEHRVAAMTGRSFAVAVSSGTSALYLALRALGVGPGDEVLCSGLSWPSPAHVIMELGAVPVVVDVDPHTWNVTADGMASCRTERTVAAVVVDFLGAPADVGAMETALGVPVVVDGACSLGSERGGGPALGSGLLSCTSFHPRKVITTGEGGMVLTNDGALDESLRTLRNHGQWTDGGGTVCFERASGNHRMTEMAAALGTTQLDHLPRILQSRRSQRASYEKTFGHLRWQVAAPGTVANHQTVGFVAESAAEAIRIRAGLRARGVQAGLLGFALGQLPSLGSHRKRTPVAEQIEACGVSLPAYCGMSDGTMRRVVRSLGDVL